MVGRGGGDRKYCFVGAKHRVRRLNPVMKAVRIRRNKMLAHLDPETVCDPVRLFRDAKLTVDDLATIFGVAGQIINEISRLYMNATHLTAFPFQDDYKLALKLIA